MTDKQDLSLLTDLHTWVCTHCFASGVISGADQDEAQKQHDAQNNRCHYHTLVLKPSSPFIREMHAAFIAARAENKQLSRRMCEVCHTQSWETTPDGFRCSYCWLLAENVRLAHENKRKDEVMAKLTYYAAHEEECDWVGKNSCECGLTALLQSEKGGE